MPSNKSIATRSLLPIVRVMGLLLLCFSVAYLLPIGWSLGTGDGTAGRFALSMAINFAAGALLLGLTWKHKREIRPREGFLLVGLIWVVLSASATLPLLLCIPGLSFTDAYFETMSGFTTTGATVITGLDNLPPAVNLWRHEMTWFGGLGIIGLAMAVLPLLGIGGMQVYKAEATGPIKDAKLTPRIAQTAKSLWLIYLGLTVVCTLTLKGMGMSWLDAICHSFSVLSLGGFSTHDASVGYFNSFQIELVLMAFMLMAGINFATHFTSWREGSARPYLRDSEAHWYLLLVLGSCLLVGLGVWWHGDVQSLPLALRQASFNVISVASTTGLVTTDYALWPVYAPLWMLLLSCLSVSAGSTGGGIKMIRTMILFKQSMREMRQLLHPSSVQALKIGRDTVQERVVMSVLGFIHLYTISIITLTFLLLISGLDFLSSFTAVIATINNAGPGLGAVGPSGTYAPLTDFQTWVCTASMLLGRLEIFVLIVPFTPAFWRE